MWILSACLHSRLHFICKNWKLRVAECHKPHTLLTLMPSATSRQKQLKQRSVDEWVHLSHLSPVLSMTPGGLPSVRTPRKQQDQTVLYHRITGRVPKICANQLAPVFSDSQSVPGSVCCTHMLQEVQHHSCARENKTSLNENLRLHLLITTQHTGHTSVCLLYRPLWS